MSDGSGAALGSASAPLMGRRVAVAALVAALGTLAALPGSQAGGKAAAGESVAYSVHYHAVPETWLAGGGLCIVDANGGPSRRLTGPEFDFAPTWAPSGTRLAFSSAGTRPQPHGFDVFTLDLRSDAIRGITTTDEWNEFNVDPAWSPNGKQLALAVGFRSGAIIVYAFASRDAWEVGVEDQSVASPTWSPDGGRIAYASSNPLGAAIYEADALGGVVAWRLLVPDASEPAFSPDGTRLAYVARGNVVVARADGSEPRVLADTPETESDPDWSPDGTRIAFARKGEAGSAIVVASMDGGAERVLVRSPFELSGPAWRPGGGIPGGRQPCIRSGMPGRDRLGGTRREDVIRGEAGADRLNGYGARDLLDGGDGADVVEGGSGNDLLIGGRGRDLILGGDGRDTIWARDGAPDRVACGRGKDYVYADFRDSLVADCDAVDRRASAS